ncbi:LysM peptidoglycan-binding domain-containing protein [Gelidibacter maritimus]|uniref:LysM peptidoglycan-binding domain-containing protein n=1 Tax=Gelidibacter maritimus TaxID=2761487 RepID=A0A7W2M429_9FLAO|nr:LysM peptidoglycan-binding domain-containing protein [Gelidibacter maritimus]MBA6152329.1 LysM peptidoglycan-binding domain-containing protein [Gelidibacter maritimus]
MKRLFQCFTLLFLCFYSSIAQEGLKKHTVSSGETLFSIAKKYNVTPYDLQKMNPEIINGINVDAVLLIPESKIKTPILESASDSIKASVTSSSISYTVKKGDTKFSVSKRFGLTITQLESQNPQIIEGLNLGDVLEIYPAPSYVSTKTSSGSSNPEHATPTSPQISSKTTRMAPDGKRHLVRAGETFARIANANGLTVDQLKNANSRILSRGLIAGQTLWIPSSDQLGVAGDTVSYVVKNGDTKFILSRRFNTSIRQLERNNPHIANVLEIGHVITMPSASGSSSSAQAPVKQSITNPVDQTPVTKEEVGKSEPKKTTPTVATTIDTPKTQPKIAEAKSKTPEVVVAEKTETKDSEVAPKDPEVTTVETPDKKKAVPTPPKKVVTQKAEAKKTVTQKQESQPAVTTSDKQIETATGATPSEISATEYIAYTIQPKETIYGLAAKSGMSIADFLILNPKLKESVQAGTVIKMPKSVTSFEPPSENLSTAKVPRDFSVPVDLSTTANTSQLKRLLFILPFSQAEYQSLDGNNDNFKDVSDDFKRVHLEFYKGANIAFDSIKKMYLSLNVDIIEAQSNLRTSKIMPLLEEGRVTNYDAIILPFYDTVEEDVAAFTAESKTPVISASPIASKSTANNLYSAVPSVDFQRKKTLDYILSKGAHIVVLNDANRAESKAFISEHAPSAEFVSIKKNGSFSENELIASLKKDQRNVVVIDSERTSVFLNATNTLLSELSNFNIQLAVLESALIPEDGHVSEKRFRILNMVFPSLIPAKSTASSKQFLSAYQKKYNLLPSANVMLGFDITFDSLLRLLQKQTFENSAERDITEYTQLKFDYEKNNLGGFSNEGIYILQYDSEANVREAN